MKFLIPTYLVNIAVRWCNLVKASLITKTLILFYLLSIFQTNFRDNQQLTVKVGLFEELSRIVNYIYQ